MSAEIALEMGSIARNCSKSPQHRPKLPNNWPKSHHTWPKSPHTRPKGENHLNLAKNNPDMSSSALAQDWPTSLEVGRIRHMVGQRRPETERIRPTNRQSRWPSSPEIDRVRPQVANCARKWYHAAAHIRQIRGASKRMHGFLARLVLAMREALATQMYSGVQEAYRPSRSYILLRNYARSF